MKKIIELIKNPLKIFIFLNNRNILTLSDEKYLSLKYYIMIHKKINLEKPETFNEKLQWLKLYDRNPEYTKMVDKYEIKKYVASVIGEEYIIPTLGIYDSFDDIDFDKLPNKFVMKCTHDSGSTIICNDKNNFEIKRERKKVIKNLKRNFYLAGREWPYKNIKPRIIIEKYMQNKDEDELKDYKLMCFNGKVRCSFVCSDRYNNKGLKVDFFDINWNKMPFERKYPNST